MAGSGKWSVPACYRLGGIPILLRLIICLIAVPPRCC